MLEYVAYGCGGNMCELLGSRYQDGLNVRSQFPVGVCYGTLCLEIYHIPYTSHYVLYTQFLACVDGQVVIFDHPDSFKPFSGLADDLHPLFCAEEPVLVDIDAYGDDYFIEHSQGAFQYVQVPCGKRVKRPWK